MIVQDLHELYIIKLCTECGDVYMYEVYMCIGLCVYMYMHVSCVDILYVGCMYMYVAVHVMWVTCGLYLRLHDMWAVPQVTYVGCTSGSQSL